MGAATIALMTSSSNIFPARLVNVVYSPSLRSRVNRLRSAGQNKSSRHSRSLNVELRP